MERDFGIILKFNGTYCYNSEDWRNGNQRKFGITEKAIVNEDGDKAIMQNGEQNKSVKLNLCTLPDPSLKLIWLRERFFSSIYMRHK